LEVANQRVTKDHLSILKLRATEILSKGTKVASDFHRAANAHVTTLWFRGKNYFHRATNAPMTTLQLPFKSYLHRAANVHVTTLWFRGKNYFHRTIKVHALTRWLTVTSFFHRATNRPHCGSDPHVTTLKLIVSIYFHRATNADITITKLPMVRYFPKTLSNDYTEVVSDKLLS